MGPSRADVIALEDALAAERERGDKSDDHIRGLLGRVTNERDALREEVAAEKELRQELDRQLDEMTAKADVLRLERRKAYGAFAKYWDGEDLAVGVRFLRDSLRDAKASLADYRGMVETCTQARVTLTRRNAKAAEVLDALTIITSHFDESRHLASIPEHITKALAFLRGETSPD